MISQKNKENQRISRTNFKISLRLISLDLINFLYIDEKVTFLKSLPI